MWQLPVGIGVGIWYSGQSPRRAITATGLTLAGAAVIRSIGWRTAAAGAYTLGMTPALYIVGAVTGGALVGTGASYALFGKEGAKAAVDFYTDPFDLDKAKTIADIPSNIAAITQANRAVVNNAAGLPTGTNVAAKQTGQGMMANPTHPFAEWWGTN